MANRPRLDSRSFPPTCPTLEKTRAETTIPTAKASSTALPYQAERWK